MPISAFLEEIASSDTSRLIEGHLFQRSAFDHLYRQGFFGSAQREDFFSHCWSVRLPNGRPLYLFMFSPEDPRFHSGVELPRLGPPGSIRIAFTFGIRQDRIDFLDPEGREVGSLLGGLGLERRFPEHRDLSSGDRKETALRELLAQTEDRVTTYVASRYLSNRLLSTMSRDYVDMDLIVLVGSRPVVLEHKRKYPARNNTIGLDYLLADHLIQAIADSGGAALYLYTFLPKYGRATKADSPLLEKYRLEWQIFARTLQERDLLLPTMRTTGSDSGAFSTGERRQVAIPADEFRGLDARSRLLDLI